MNWSNLLVNLIAIFAGLFLYIGISHTKWGKEHAQYQYAIMLAAVLLACLIGGLLRFLFGFL